MEGRKEVKGWCIDDSCIWRGNEKCTKTDTKRRKKVHILIQLLRNISEHKEGWERETTGGKLSYSAEHDATGRQHSDQSLY